jgi:hypothetical protein
MSDIGKLLEFASDLVREAKIERRVVEAVTATAREVQATASSTAPRETGELAGSFEIEGAGVNQAVVNRTRQAFFQEFGTSRHGPQASLLVQDESAGESLRRRVEPIVGREL